MSDQPRTERRTPRSRPLTAAMVAIVPMVAGGCYTSLGAGAGGGRLNGKSGVRGTGSVAVGGALDIGGARFGLGAVPVGQSLSYGAEARAEICIRSSPQPVSHGKAVPNCSADLRRTTLNVRIHWLPGLYLQDMPVEYPSIANYDTGLFVAMGVGLDGRSALPSEVARVIEYGNVATGLFYSHRWFDDRSGDWTAGAFLEFSFRVDILTTIVDAATRKPH